MTQPYSSQVPQSQVPQPQQFQYPYAVFTGAYGDNSTGAYYPARAEISNGWITLWVITATGWAQVFSVAATEVTVKSAAQRITLVVRGQSYPLLADPTVVTRVLRYGTAGTVATVLDHDRFAAGVDVSRGLTQVSAAGSWVTQGGPEFIAAARASGARTSRMGYGALIGIGCGAGLAVVLLVTVVTVAMLSL